MASDDSSNDGYHSTDMLIASKGILKGQWVLDSGCSFHVCPNKSLFYEYSLLLVVEFLWETKISMKLLG